MGAQTLSYDSLRHQGEHDRWNRSELLLWPQGFQLPCALQGFCLCSSTGSYQQGEKVLGKITYFPTVESIEELRARNAPFTNLKPCFMIWPEIQTLFTRVMNS